MKQWTMKQWNNETMKQSVKPEFIHKIVFGDFFVKISETTVTLKFRSQNSTTKIVSTAKQVLSTLQTTGYLKTEGLCLKFLTRPEVMNKLLLKLHLSHITLLYLGWEWICVCWITEIILDLAYQYWLIRNFVLRFEISYIIFWLKLWNIQVGYCTSNKTTTNHQNQTIHVSYF